MMTTKMMQMKRNSMPIAAPASHPPTPDFKFSTNSHMENGHPRIPKKTALMDSISLPVVSPTFERLKRNGIWLHSLAGALILAHAVSHFRSETTHTLYFWCLLLISLDIFLLVIAGRDLLHQLPRVNLFFRLVEIIFFFCIGTLMIIEGNELTGIVH